MISTAYQDDKFNRYCFFAFSLHLGIVLLVLVINQILGWNILKSQNNKVDIIQASVRVDIVEMPKFTVQELKAMKVDPAPTAPEEVEGSTKDEPQVEKVESKVDLSNILNSLSKKEVVAKPSKKVKGEKIDKKVLKKLLLEGNKVSKGATAVGDAYAKEQTQFNSYITTLPEYVRPYWKLPSYLLENESLNCRIKIYIDASGKIIKSEIISSSGVVEYDQKAMQAVKATANLPPPPREILSKVSSGKVILGFPL